ncbi:hypothetical protein MSG28_014581 [Choristoneura fumiferana]|uniref:Uncharacterized protein n=1 Tax=Choristoneura fumiferana TaxID=7141 RepID=A0ACC0JRY1_CHOFU|nr:hypothetical protein MSG28_014581 [Choristoneura fumiferana]
MLLRVLKPESEKLGYILRDLDKPDLLWSKFGLRSLSKSSPLYMKRNTEHDPPYWRGQVWVNINYLALSALRHYSRAGGPHAARAGQLHDRLRENIVREGVSHILLKPSLKDPTVGDCLMEVGSRFHSLADCTVKDLDNFTGCLTLHAETQQCKHCCFTAGLASKMVVAIRADPAQGPTTCCLVVRGNLLSEYRRTGYFWEQYSGEDGAGAGCRPFTGWTGLLPLLMAGEY